MLLPKMLLPGDMLRCCHFTAPWGGMKYEFIIPAIRAPHAYQSILTIVQRTVWPHGEFYIVTAELGAVVMESYHTQFEFEILNR